MLHFPVEEEAMHELTDGRRRMIYSSVNLFGTQTPTLFYFLIAYR